MSNVKCQINVRLRRILFKIIIPSFVIFNLSFVILAGSVYAELIELGVEPLRVELAGRPLGMGGGFAGLADDTNAILYNPGGLAWTKGISLSIKDSENIAALQAYPAGNNSAFGLAIITSKFSDIPFSGGLANSNSNVVYLSYGTKLNFIPRLADSELFQHLGFGLSVKGLLGQTLRRAGMLDRSATGWDMDFGVLWKAEDWWSAGFTLQNFLPIGTLGGGSINWDIGGQEGIPAVAKLAGSARVIGDIGSPIFMEGRQLLLAGELNVSRNRPLLMRFGGEYGFNKSYYLRTGFTQQFIAGGATSDINFGLGYRTERWGVDLASYRDPFNDQRYLCLSVLYFPEDWIILRELDIDKPRVMIDQPIETISLEDNIVTYDDKIDVYGRVKPGVEVYINGLRASLGPDNSFKAVIPLHLKKNLIIVEARYLGEKKVWKYKVFRKAKVEIADKDKTENLAKKKEGVENLVTMGVIEITPDQEFVMDAGITRGELSSWLVKAAEMKLPEVRKDLFADVPKDHPLAPYIKVVVDLNLLRPFPDGTFRPAAIVSKEEGDAIFAKFGITQ
ncbi:MAG: S-layer homology domain-containing protein [Candidatus Margulisbacteria bacterium]|nr:S-layer homology domain-containing protein [Candidatus Margulisiibacteriota bacterium]